MEVEIIAKEVKRMEKRIKEPILSFISIVHQPSKVIRQLEVKERYLTTTSSIVPILQVVLLATCEPPPLVLPSMDQLQFVIR